MSGEWGGSVNETHPCVCVMRTICTNVKYPRIGDLYVSILEICTCLELY